MFYRFGVRNPTWKNNPFDPTCKKQNEHTMMKETIYPMDESSLLDLDLLVDQ